MFSVKIGTIPENGLLNSYDRQPGCYIDCFTVEIARTVTLFEYISVFFNTPVFRLERLLLGLFASKPSDEKALKDLASGIGTTFAGWKVESRNKDQLLMSVGSGPIRTWLMIESNLAKPDVTRLYFGSGLVPVEQDSLGKPSIGLIYRLTLGFHKFYSRLLLWLAAKGLQR